MSAGTHLPSGLVTFLFTDIEGSTRLAQMLGEDYRPVLNGHREVLRGALAAGDGIELFTEGDSLFVAFADPVAALAACAEAQRALARHQWPAPQARPRVRMGLHSGYAVPVAGEYASPEVHRAARVAAAAHGGQVLCSAATARMVAAAGPRALPDAAWLLDLGLHRLRGFDGRERLFQLVAPGLDRQFPRPRTAQAPPHNLPTQLTRFVGRAAERVELTGLLGAHRLVTVVGPVGVGKTRLAVEVAGGSVAEHPDGVWFVDLSTEAAEAAVAAALGIRPEPGRPPLDTITDHLAYRRLLLVLDTCDADPPAARRLVSRVLSASPAVRVLATSREPVGLAGEVVWRLPPMPVTTLPGRGHSDAVALLIDRARTARGGSPAAPAEIEDFGRIAAALDGLPLALELAAARLRVLSAGQLAARIGDVLGTLDAGAPGAGVDAAADAPAGAAAAAGAAAGVARHGTMRAAVAWSYRTLDEPAARLLRRFSVFAGPVDLPAVEWLHAGDPLHPLAGLVDKSLVQAEPGAAGATYRMLDPIRAYAADRLAASGEEASARQRHGEWCLHRVRAARRDGARPSALSLYAFDPLADELRAALGWTASDGDVRQGLAIITALDPWWQERGLAGEGRAWLCRMYQRIAGTHSIGHEDGPEPAALDRAGTALAGRDAPGGGDALEDGRVPPAELAGAYLTHARLAALDGESAEGVRLLLARAAQAARAALDPALVARVLAGRASLLAYLGRVEEAERACRQVIAQARARGLAGEVLPAVYSLARLLWRRGALDEAARLLALARSAEAVHPADRALRTVDLVLGLVALSRGDLIAAHEHLVVALRSRISHGFHASACEALNAMAVRCALGDELELAARLFGSTQAAAPGLRGRPEAFAWFWGRYQTMVQTGLGDSAFDAAYAEGASLSLDEASSVALAVEHPDLVVGSGRF